MAEIPEPAVARVISCFREFIRKENAWRVRKRGVNRYPTCENWDFTGTMNLVQDLPVISDTDVIFFLLFLEKKFKQLTCWSTELGEARPFEEIAKLFPLAT